MIKISVFIILIFIPGNISHIESDLFCDDGKIDTALTHNKKTFLFRKNKIWVFDSQTKLVSNQSISLKNLIRGLLFANHYICV